MNKIDRNIYLSNIEFEKAKEMFFSAVMDSIKNMGTETIKVTDSLDRVTSKPVFAKISSPFFNASAMDGIAVKSVDTYGADERNPKRLIHNRDFIFVDTGDVIKEPYDSVIMIEDVAQIDEGTVEIYKAASPWQNIRPVGEDIVANEMILPAFHRIRPMDIGALLSGGILEIEVIVKPKIGIIPTGTEIIEPEDDIAEGKIIESNSRMFEGLVRQYGAVPKRYKSVKDDYILIRNAILNALEENDMVIVNAGSSAGTEDYTSKIVEELGTVIAHGIAIKPGKPAILGKVKNKPVIGIPGYPVSAYFVFDAFVKPLIYKYLNVNVPQRPTVEAVLSKRLVSSIKHLEFVRIKIGKVGENLIATPLNRGAGVTMSLVRADGILPIPKNVEGIEAGERVRVQLLKDLENIENTIVSIGSHDLILDIIGNMLHTKYLNANLSSAHVGSLGGVMAIRRGEAHIAPVHLLDEGTGTYNVEYAKRYLKNMDVAIIKGVKRIQGFMVKKGNPKDIKSIEDLTRNDVVFANRQRGSGTRILLDYKLRENGIDPQNINGYDREMTTHMAVASAVLSGTADVGIGIKSAANTLGLDFIPIGEEEYDFIIPSKFLEEEKVKAFIEILKSGEFKQELEILGGYIVEEPGKVIVP